MYTTMADEKTNVIAAGGNSPLIPSPVRRDDLTEIGKFFATGSTNSAPTLADFKRLVGITPAVVRVKGAGQRGLRWSVVSVDDKSGRVKIAATNGDGQTDTRDYLPTALVIAPCSDARRRG